MTYSNEIEQIDLKYTLELLKLTNTLKEYEYDFEKAKFLTGLIVRDNIFKEDGKINVSLLAQITELIIELDKINIKGVAQIVEHVNNINHVFPKSK